MAEGGARSEGADLFGAPGRAASRSAEAQRRLRGGGLRRAMGVGRPEAEVCDDPLNDLRLINGRNTHPELAVRRCLRFSFHPFGQNAIHGPTCTGVPFESLACTRPR